MKKTKYISFAIVIAIAGLMITSGASLPTNVLLDTLEQENLIFVERNKATVVTLDSEPQHLSIQREEDTNPTNPGPAIIGNPAFAFPENQLHPAFARTDSGLIMAAYYNQDLDNIVFTGSNNDGASFLNGLSWDIGGDYPSIKRWEGSRFFGTFVTDSTDNDGGVCYLFESTNPTQPLSYNLIKMDFSSQGWHDMIDADIACNNQQDEWEWGAHSFVISITLEDGYTNVPAILFADPDDPDNSVVLSWYWLEGCAHCDIEIDPVTQIMYAVYDWNNAKSGKWELLVRVLDMTDPLGTNDNMHIITGNGNLQYPAVAAYDNNLYILAETDENGNKDIICYYSEDGMPNLLTKFVANTVDDERYPDIRRFEGTPSVAATFVKENNIYATMTGGENWDNPWQINNNDDIVVEEYKTSDLCDSAKKAMWEETHDDIDIYIETATYNSPPKTTNINGPNSGNKGKSYDYKFTATDPDGDDVKFFIEWGDESTKWSDLTSSGTPITISHTWSEKGTYSITAKAQDSNGLTGPKTILPVTMPKNKLLVNSLFLQLLEWFPNAFPILRYLFGL